MSAIHTDVLCDSQCLKTHLDSLVKVGSAALWTKAGRFGFNPVDGKMRGLRKWVGEGRIF